VAASQRPGTDEEAAIVQAVLDYFEGWFDGDATRMERALHPALAKRSLDPRGAGEDALDETSAQWMIEATAQGIGKQRDVEERGIQIRVDDVSVSIAAVTVHSTVYTEYVHLARTTHGWKIVNTLWRFNVLPPPGVERSPSEAVEE
jgi:hypothetical protein